MATSALRAAQLMRLQPLSKTWKQTSRTMSASIILRGNKLCHSSLKHWQPEDKDTNRLAMTFYQPIRYDSTASQSVSEVEDTPATRKPSTVSVTPDVRTLDRIMIQFEDRCQRNEKVDEKDFVRTFNLLTRVVDQFEQADNPNFDMSNIVQYSSLLLRCCGKLMFDTPPKGRELLAGNLWTYIKARRIPLDISHFNSLIRVMNENETVYDPQKILDEIAQLNLQSDRVTYQRLIHQYCLQGDITSATKLLEVMKNESVELNEATFASLLIGYSKQEKPPAISEMFDLMRQNDVEPGAKSYSAALIAQAERFARDPEGAAAELEKIIELLEKDEVQLSSNDYIDIISHLGPFKDSHEVVATFFDRYIDNLYGSIGHRYRLLSSLLRVNQRNLASHLFWSQNVHERAIQAGNVGSYYIRAMAKNFNVPTDFAIQECIKLSEKQWNHKPLHTLYFTAAEAGNLDMVRAAKKKLTEQEPMKTIYIWPLLAQAKNQDEVIRVLREDLDPKMDTSELIETFSLWVWGKFTDPQKLFDLNKELQFDVNMLVASFLNYSVQENKITEAIEFIRQAQQDLVGESSQQPEATEEDNDEAEPSVTPRRTTERGDLIARLLNHIADQTKDPELVKKTFNMVQVADQQVSTRSLSALVRVHLLNNNFEGALQQFLEICKEYRSTPSRTELMNHCLVNKDPENLQKIMNAVSEIYGEANSLFDLAVCCLWSNKLKQAQKIFASPGFRVRPIRVYQTCRTVARQGNIAVLENFVNLTRDMYDINQEYLYQVLIDTYDRTSNAKRALNLWNIMQEEEFQPSKKSLLMIANLLEKNNIQVPFQKPKTNYTSRPTMDRVQREDGL